MGYIENDLTSELPDIGGLPELEEEQEVQSPMEYEETEEPKEEPKKEVKVAKKVKVKEQPKPKRPVTINDVIMNHENRIKEIESGMFRLMGGL